MKHKILILSIFLSSYCFADLQIIDETPSNIIDEKVKEVNLEQQPINNESLIKTIKKHPLTPWVIGVGSVGLLKYGPDIGGKPNVHPYDRISHFLVGSVSSFILAETTSDIYSIPLALSLGPLKEHLDLHYDPVDGAASMWGVATGLQIQKMLQDKKCPVKKEEKINLNQSSILGSTTSTLGIHSNTLNNVILGKLSGGTTKALAIGLTEGIIGNNLEKQPYETRKTLLPLYTGALSTISMTNGLQLFFETSHPIALGLGLSYGIYSGYKQREEIDWIEQNCTQDSIKNKFATSIFENIKTTTILFLIKENKETKLQKLTLNFDFGSSSLSKKEEDKILKLFEIYNDNLIYFDIYGKADLVGSDEYKKNLASHRAKKIEQFLIKHKIHEDLINTN